MTTDKWTGAKLEAIYQQEFQVRAYEVGSRGTIKLSSLLDYLQESASQHASRLGVSVKNLIAKNLTWVLSRYHVKIFRYPAWGEKVVIRTWPSAKINLFALREFEVLNHREEPIAIATSSWLLIDLRTKQAVRLEDHLPHYARRSNRAIEDAFEALPEVIHPEIELPFRVRLADLDVNRHVNHVRSIEWALEAVPSEIWKHNEPEELEIAFRGEAFYGDQIIARSQRLDPINHPTFIHQLFRESDQKEIIRLKSCWKRLSRQ
ncbi:MAG: thioesterase [candidate division KSB1 bacterium]|nr:thioesterase [candidate division KSB1 bacterium]MDZ7334256.1 thioesterase [candidate division KSB1 bacterium]MDZ7356346.1 thioesterase [candidate division KSB1 bacterium]MDZ7375818.1 thioesterase [candidate division KSB1 bacterium]MDZ7401038.1 thioesterase [candidate division KSB1 bacterium]